MNFLDGRTTNQIDHTVLRSRWPSSVGDCCTFRGIITGKINDTDDLHVRARFRLRFSTHPKKTTLNRLNDDALQVQERCDELRTVITLQPLRTDKVSMKNQWKALKMEIKEGV